MDKKKDVTVPGGKQAQDKAAARQSYLLAENLDLTEHQRREIESALEDFTTYALSSSLAPGIPVEQARALGDKWRAAYGVAIEYDQKHGLRDTTVQLGGMVMAADELDTLIASASAQGAASAPTYDTSTHITWNADGIRTVNGVPDTAAVSPPAPQLADLASAMKKMLPPALLAEVIAHLDPLTPFVEFMRADPPSRPAPQWRPILHQIKADVTAWRLSLPRELIPHADFIRLLRILDAAEQPDPPASSSKTIKRRADMNLTKLSRDIRFYNDQKGFETPADHPKRKLLLAISEICEAQEELRDGHSPTEVYYAEKWEDDVPGAGDAMKVVIERKPCGFGVEIADAIIRLLDLCCAFHHEVEIASWEVLEDIEDELLGIVNGISAAHSVSGHSPYFGDLMCQAIGQLWSLAEREEINILKLIEEKLEFNKSRPPKHGRQF